MWFAQACCSAGSDSPTAYAGLFKAGSLLDQTLTGIAKLDAATAPLARALLGATKPLRASIGHVDRLSTGRRASHRTDKYSPATSQRLSTTDMSGQSVGLSGYYPAIGSLLQKYVKARQKYNSVVGPAAKPSLDMLVYSRVTAHDRASTVILGDPTAAIPLPH